MPLITGKSPSSFSKNVQTEMEAGKPLKQSLAIAYAMKRKAEKMAKGGMCYAHGTADCKECYAEGGEIHEDDRKMNQHGALEVGPRGMEDDSEHMGSRVVEHAIPNQDEVDDMVGRIMKQRQEFYSEGGAVANDTDPTAEFEENEFDYMVKNDTMPDFHYTERNSGDDRGNAQEDEDRRDIIERIMRSRRLKDRLPRPA